MTTTTKIPTIMVPVTVFLDLVRSYVENPQELLNRQTYMEATHLEKKAYRKYLAYKKAAKKEIRTALMDI